MEIQQEELKQEESLLYKQIENIMFINEFSPEEKDELYTLILKLIDNKIAQEGYCNR